MADPDGSSQSGVEPTNLRLRKSELAAAWADVSHALRGFYELADILIVLDEVLLLEISNFARQLKFSPVIGDDHPIITHLMASLWFRSMDLTITSSTSKSRGPSNERKNVAATEKQLESMVYKREGPIETYPKFWNLNPLTASGQEVLRIPAWKKSFELVKRQLEAILEKEVLPTTIPEFPTVRRRMTLGMNSSLVVPSLFARAAAEGQQREFTDGWDPLFIGYTAAVYFHTCDIKINSWTTQAKKMRGSLPPKFEIREVLRKLERAGLENMLPVWTDGRMIVEEGHIALKDEMKFATRRYRAPYGLEQVEMRQEGKELDAAGPLYVALTEYKKPDPTTPSPLSVGTPGDKRSGPVEDRFRRILERRRVESGEESIDETLSEAGEDMEVGNTPEPKPSEEEFTTQELLKDLSGENWADTPTPPLTSSPRKNLELPLMGENSNMGMILLSAEERENNTFEGNKTMFLGTLDEDAWREFLSEFNREVDGEFTLDDFKEELWDTVVKFGEPVLMGTGLEEKARGELLSKMVELRKASQKTKEDECQDSSTLKQKTVNRIIESVRGDKVEISNIIKSTNILKARAGGGKSWKGWMETERSNQ